MATLRYSFNGKRGIRAFKMARAIVLGLLRHHPGTTTKVTWRRRVGLLTITVPKAVALSTDRAILDAATGPDTLAEFGDFGTANFVELVLRGNGLPMPHSCGVGWRLVNEKVLHLEPYYPPEGLSSPPRSTTRPVVVRK